MSLVRIQDLSAVTSPLAAATLFEVEQAGASAKATLGDAQGLVLTSLSAAYGFVLLDKNTGFTHASADTTARIWTIPANASVAFPLGTQLVGFNENGAGVITIAITTDTMYLAGAGTTGSRTLAANGYFVATKLTATVWQIAGVGLT